MNTRIELLSIERVIELWPKIEPLLDKACKAHEIVIDELTTDDIYILTIEGEIIIFAGFENEELSCVLAIQFSTTNGHKSVDIIALAGRNCLTTFRKMYWQYILNWFKVNGVEFVNAYTYERLAKICTRWLGFNKSCIYTRLKL